MKKTLVIGSTVADVIVRVNHLPRTGEDLAIEEQTLSLGGCAYNVFHALKLFDSPALLFSPVGTGIYGDFVFHSLAAAEIHSAAPRVNEENGCCYCFVEPDGERTFVCRYGAEYLFRREWFDALDPDEIGGVYLCGLELEHESGELLIDYLEAHPEFSVYFAPGPRIGSIPSERLERIFRLKPLVHLNAVEALTVTGCNNLQRAVKALCNITDGGTVVITLGARGVICAQGDWMEEVPAQAVQVQDTIGAGDSHIGAMIAGLTRGLTLSQAAANANRFAGAVTANPGAILPRRVFETLHFDY